MTLTTFDALGRGHSKATGQFTSATHQEGDPMALGGADEFFSETYDVHFVDMNQMDPREEAQIIAEVKSMMQLARRQGSDPSLVGAWLREFDRTEKAPSAV